MSTDAIQRAAEVMAANWKRMHTNESLGFQRMLAQALADAGLLPTETEWGTRHGPTFFSYDFEGSARAAARAYGSKPVTRNVTPWKDAS